VGRAKAKEDSLRPGKCDTARKEPLVHRSKFIQAAWQHWKNSFGQKARSGQPIVNFAGIRGWNTGDNANRRDGMPAVCVFSAIQAHDQARLGRWPGDRLPAHVQAGDADSRDCFDDQQQLLCGSGLTGEFSSKALAAAGGSKVLPEISLRA
jgi:hypothetical protein